MQSGSEARPVPYSIGRVQLRWDCSRAETRFRLPVKWTSPCDSAGVAIHSSAGWRAVRISLQGLYCSCKPMFCSHVTPIGYPLHSLVSPSLLLLRVTACHVILIGLYQGLIPQGLRICGAIHPLLHMPSWRAQGLYLTLNVVSVRCIDVTRIVAD